MDEITDSWWPLIISLLLAIIWAIRLFVAGNACSSKIRMDQKVVVVTGGSSGLGLETARDLAERGAYVIIATRNAQKGKAALEYVKTRCPNCTIIARLLDLTNSASIQEFVSGLNADFESVDVLINNAGVIYLPYTKTVDGFEATMATNYFGPFLLSHLMLPLLNKSPNGRIINVSAAAHFRAKLDFDKLSSNAHDYTEEVFSQSKLALTMFTRHFALLLKSTRITVNAVNPGLCRGTNHLRNSKLTTSLSTKMMVWPWMWLFLKTPKQGAQTIIHAAVDPTLKDVSGKYFSNCEAEDPAEAVRDRESCEKLYKKTCAMVQINPETIFKDIIVQ